MFLEIIQNMSLWPFQINEKAYLAKKIKTFFSDEEFLFNSNSISVCRHII